jgi:cysteine desulfurase
MPLTDNSVMRHYFDWAATAPPSQDAVRPEASVQAVSFGNPPFGNPSSRHTEGRAAREALESARSRCAAILGVKPETLYFTSGGTEANCIALFSNLLRPSGRIIASPAEHSSIGENMETLRRLGKLTGSIAVDSYGRVSHSLLAKSLEKYGDVRFAAVMAVNNETGTINDISALSGVLRSPGVPVHLHCDMVQAAGKIPIDLDACDSASISAHKIGGPRGIGLLYLRRPLEALYSGGGQEGKIRPGTENPASALALAQCLEKYAATQTVKAEHEKAKGRLKRLINALAETGRCTLIPAERKADDDAFSPYILQAAFRDIPGELMVRVLDDLGFAVSTGSACSSASSERPVLRVMGLDEKTSLEGIRISQGWSSTDEEVELLIKAINKALGAL